MNEVDFKALINSMDDQSFKYDFEYSKAFEALYTEHEKELTDEQKEKLRGEVLLFRLRTINRMEEADRPRFAPMVEYTDGTFFPDPDGFSEDTLDYFRARVSETTHPILRARYLDIIWEKGGQENRYEIGKQLVEAYLEAFRKYPHDYEIERIDSLYRALEIAKALEKNKPGDLLEACMGEIKGYIEKLHKSKTYRWMLDAIEILVKKANVTDKDELKKYLPYVDQAVEHYAKTDPNFTLQEAFFKLKSELSQLIDPQSYTPQNLAEDTAQSLIKEAERRTDSMFVQQHFYGQAADAYKRAGMTEKADEMVRKIRELGQSEDYDQQFKSFSQEMVIPNEELDKYRKALGAGSDLPLKLGLSKNFVPDWDNAVKLSEELSKEFVTQKLFTRTTIGSEGYPVANASGDEDEDYIMEQFNLQASLIHSLIRNFLREKIANKEVRFSDFTKLLKKIRKIDEDTYDTVKQGLRAFFHKDFLAANMILTTQLEDLLRKLMPQFGLNPTRQHPTEPRVYEEKTLNRILKEYRPILGENTYHNLVYVLIDKKHHYLRHKDAHGFIKSKDDNELYSTIVLQLYCALLAPLQIRKKRSK